MKSIISRKDIGMELINDLEKLEPKELHSSTLIRMPLPRVATTIHLEIRNKELHDFIKN